MIGKLSHKKTRPFAEFVNCFRCFYLTGCFGQPCSILPYHTALCQKRGRIQMKVYGIRVYNTSPMRTGFATMTLDSGKCPPWLFERMVRLGRVISLAIIEEFGSKEFLRRLADPVWFQSLGTLMAFDWNASGLTITTTAALKEALRGVEADADIYICGGKGKTSKKTPEQIMDWSWKLGISQEESDRLVYTSRAAAKVDSALVQDGFSLYHHTFVFNSRGEWSVVQQGMSTILGRARRYHWLGEHVTSFVEEPHSGIATQAKIPKVLDLTSKHSAENKKIQLQLLTDEKTLFRSLKVLSDAEGRQLKILDLPGIEFSHHPVEKDFVHPQLQKSLEKAIISKPSSFERLLMTPGVGGKTVRALSLVSEVIYGAKPSYEDPARYSFAYGGKDGTPYPVDRETYDKTLAVLERAIRKSKLGLSEKNDSIKRLNVFQLRKT